MKTLADKKQQLIDFINQLPNEKFLLINNQITIVINNHYCYLKPYNYLGVDISINVSNSSFMNNIYTFNTMGLQEKIEEVQNYLMIKKEGAFESEINNILNNL